MPRKKQTLKDFLVGKKIFLTVSQVAALLDKDRATLYRWFSDKNQRKTLLVPLLNKHGLLED